MPLHSKLKIEFLPREDVAVLKTTLLYTGEEETEVYT